VEFRSLRYYVRIAGLAGKVRTAEKLKADFTRDDEAEDRPG
jgi:hypothetical protein